MSPPLRGAVRWLVREFTVLYITVRLAVAWTVRWFMFRSPSMKAKIAKESGSRAHMPPAYGPGGAGSSIELWQVLNLRRRTAMYNLIGEGMAKLPPLVHQLSDSIKHNLVFTTVSSILQLPTTSDAPSSKNSSFRPQPSLYSLGYTLIYFGSWTCRGSNTKSTSKHFCKSSNTVWQVFKVVRCICNS